MASANTYFFFLRSLMCFMFFRAFVSLACAKRASTPWTWPRSRHVSTVSHPRPLTERPLPRPTRLPLPPPHRRAAASPAARHPRPPTPQERRQVLEEELARTERQIYELEEEYLQETVKDGNILRGWDGYLGVLSLIHI